MCRCSRRAFDQFRSFLTTTTFLVLSFTSYVAIAQNLIMSDDFEAAGTTANPTIWPLTTSTHVESGLTYFGAGSRYLRLTGGSTRALSANWGTQLNGQPSTFAFDYYEPSTSANTLTLGYSAGNADINTAEAFVRIALTGGSISMSS